MTCLALLAASLLSPDPAGPEIQRRLRADVWTLASDAMGGRDTGSREVAAAEELIASRLQSLGLEPLPGRSSLFVEFPLEREGFDPACTRAVIETAAGSSALVAEIDW